MTDDELLDEVTRWRREGRGVALATVVATWGSSPRPVGSLLAADSAGAFIGSVSGGCVEAAVVAAAREAIARGGPRLLAFRVGNERAWEVGLACGGAIEVHVNPLTPERDRLLEVLRRARAEKRAAALVTALDGGGQAVISSGRCEGELALTERERADVEAATAADNGRVVGEGERRLFVRPFHSPLRLIIVGAVHIAEPLAAIATLAGYAVVLVDPRRGFARRDRFPGVTLVDLWPEQALAGLTTDARTAVVTLTHDAKLDDPALACALRSEAFYIGALGSARTQAGRLARLRALGFGEADLARIHGPVGLDIGALSPQEIAIAILAEITLVRRGPRRRG